jgi:hypothetical protein
MPISVLWEDAENAMLRIVCEDPWDVDDFYAAVRTIYSLLEGHPHRVDLLLDAHRSHTLPQGFIPHARRVGKDQRSNMGMLAVVGGNIHWRTFTDLLLTLCPMLNRWMVVVADEAEAYALFARRSLSPTLSPKKSSKDVFGRA